MKLEPVTSSQNADAVDDFSWLFIYFDWNCCQHSYCAFDRILTSPLVTASLTVD